MKHPSLISRQLFFYRAISLGKILLVTALLSVSFFYTALAQDSILNRQVKKNHFKMERANGQFSGAGWDSLQRAMTKAQFVLLGEQHGLAEVPIFTGALAQVFKPELFIAEIDPHTAREVERLAKQPGLPTAYERRHPFSFSFYSWAEEFDLVRQLQTQNVKTIGLDQVPTSAAGRLYLQMAQLSKNKTTRGYLNKQSTALQDKDMALFRNPTKDGIEAMIQLSEAAIDSMLLLTKKEKPEVRKMAQDFAKSYQIFQLNAKGAPNSHTTRVNMMKRNLLAELQPYGLPKNQLPKMLFKFGAGHMERGLNRWNVFDVGNLAVNLADAQDQKTLHIIIIGKQGGTQAAFNLDFSQNQADYPAEAMGYLAPYKNETDSSWGVFDLRPSRNDIIRGRLKMDESDLKSMIMGYDFLIVIPETTASKNI